MLLELSAYISQRERPPSDEKISHPAIGRYRFTFVHQLLQTPAHLGSPTVLAPLLVPLASSFSATKALTSPVPNPTRLGGIWFSAVVNVEFPSCRYS